MSDVQVDHEWLDRNILRNPKVMQACEATARRLVPLVRMQALKESDTRYADSVRLASGFRPGTKSPTGIRRGYARVLIGDPEAAVKEFGRFGERKLPKKGFLRRAAAKL